MILIAHRGNINGPNLEMENRPTYVLDALDAGYDVEIDVWRMPDGWYLGHDAPTYLIDPTFLEDTSLWCHAKNPEALRNMLSNESVHCFWHQEDDFVLTSKGYIWTYPGKSLGYKSICVLPELVPEQDFSFVSGVCSDYVEKYK